MTEVTLYRSAGLKAPRRTRVVRRGNACSQTPYMDHLFQEGT